MLGYTLFESNTLGDDSTYLVSNTTWIAQSFTPSTAHDLWTMAFKMINTAACGDVTVRIFAVDGDGKPTGSALATMTISNSDISATAADWEYNALSTALRVNEQVIAVVSAAAAGLGVRYQSTALYTAGKAWYSADSGTTWVEIVGGAFLFEDWGQEIPFYGTYDLTIYPKGAGTYTQLYNEWSTYKPNYSCVDDPLDAIDHLDGVMYTLSGDGFMSGESDSVAGTLTGTTLLWKTGTAGIAGDGTDFTSELAEGYYVKSPTTCEWYKGKSLPVSEIKSIESNVAATLTYMPGDVQGASSNRWFFNSAWYFTPSNSTDADAGKIYNSLYATQEVYLPATYMPGIWTFTTGSDTVTATGGSASSLYPDASWPMQYIGSDVWEVGGSYPPSSPGKGGAWPILSVDSDNQVTLWSDYGSGSIPGISRVMLDGKCKYCYWGWIDDLTDSDKATLWTTPTKIDTYELKTTLNEGTIYQMRIRFSAYVSGYVPAEYPNDIKGHITYLEKNISWITVATAYLTGILGLLKTALTDLATDYPTLDVTTATAQIDTTTALVAAGATQAELISATNQVLADVSVVMQEYLLTARVRVSATARPLLYMDGVYSYGTSRTIYGTNTDMSTPEMVADAVVEYEEVISRPGGGAFTADDFATLEVGIQLGNVSHERQPMRIVCTQLCLIAKVANLPSYVVTQPKYGLDDLGFISWGDGWDEFEQFVGIDGVNTMGWKTHYMVGMFERWIARPFRKMRSIGIRVIRKTNRVLALRRR